MIEVLQFGLSSNRGGIENYIFKLWNHINKDNCHFSFIDMTEDNKRPCFYNEILEAGGVFYKITPRRISVTENRRDMIELFNDHSFDILHFNVTTLSYIFPIITAMRQNCKVIVHSHSSNMISHSMTRALHDFNKNRIRKMNICRIAVSAQAGEWLFGSSPYEVVHNGLVTSDYRFTEDNRLYSRSIGNNLANNTVIGCVAAFLSVKNHVFVIDVFMEVLKKIPDAVLWLVGDGPLRKSIERMVKECNIADRVIFWGSRNDVGKLYSGMDVLLLPSLYEGYPTVMIEAQCAGLPCVVSDTITKEAFYEDSVFSVSLDETTEKWAEIVLKAINNPPAARELKYLEMDAYGVSVRDEIEKVQDIYSSLLYGNS